MRFRTTLTAEFAFYSWITRKTFRDFSHYLVDGFQSIRTAAQMQEGQAVGRPPAPGNGSTTHKRRILL